MESIYKITNPNNHIYIGRSKNTEKRFTYYKNGYCKTQIKLYNSIQFHKWENHKVEIIEIVSKNISSDREQYWIKFYKSNYKRYPKSNGLNLSDGGDGGSGSTIITVYQYDLEGNFIKEWDSQIEAVNFYGKKVNHISQVCQGKQKSTLGYRWSYNKLDKLPFFIRRNGTKYFNIVQTDLNNNIIKVWNSIGEIIRLLGGSHAAIINCFTGKSKTALGFKWYLN